MTALTTGKAVISRAKLCNEDHLSHQYKQYMSFSLIAAIWLKKGAIKAPLSETRQN